MPTYEYQCAKCKKSFELFQSMKDAALEICPENLCQQKKWGHGKVQRQIGTGAGLIFKGSGFYITDYRSEGYKASEKKEGSSAREATSESKSDTKTEAKAETKTEAKKPETKTAPADKPKTGKKD